MTTYEKETLTNLYATLDYLTCYDIDGQEAIKKAINGIEEKYR